eukprot:COSAG05_NODE_5801_length_1085_cov_1.160243_2_plen_105_part_00
MIGQTIHNYDTMQRRARATAVTMHIRGVAGGQEGFPSPIFILGAPCICTGHSSGGEGMYLHEERDVAEEQADYRQERGKGRVADRHPDRRQRLEAAIHATAAIR